MSLRDYAKQEAEGIIENAEEFGTTMTVGAATLNVILAPLSREFEIGGVLTESTVLVGLVKEDAASAANLDQGDTVTIDSVSYTVTAVRKMMYGVWRLEFRRA